jgi:hypothetical protein
MKRPPAALPPAVQPVEPTLVWQRPDGSTVDILVPLARTVTIGRGETNSVVVESAWVSKTHASVRFADGHYIVEDLQSSNGTRVNDAPIASSVLTPGDVIHIGDQTFTFVDRAAARGARRRTGQQPRGAAGKLIRLGAVAALTGGIMVVALRSLLPSEPTMASHARPASAAAPDGPADVDRLASQVTGESPRVRDVSATAGQAGIDEADALYDEGMMQLRVQRFLEAAHLFTAALEAQPEHPTARQRLDEALRGLHRTAMQLAAEGDRLASQLRWADAIAAWENVIDALPPTDGRVAQAKENIEMARQRLSP